MSRNNISVSTSRNSTSVSMSPNSILAYVAEQYLSIWRICHWTITQSVHITEQYLWPSFLKNKIGDPCHWSGGRNPRILKLRNRLSWWLPTCTGVSAQGALTTKLNLVVLLECCTISWLSWSQRWKSHWLHALGLIWIEAVVFQLRNRPDLSIDWWGRGAWSLR